MCLRQRLSLLLLWLLLRTQQAQECSDFGGRAPSNSSSISLAIRPPRVSSALSDIIGLDAAKEVLNEAVVLPATMDLSAVQLFWRSSEHSAILLVGPPGLGKLAAAEAAAAAIGAGVLPLLATEVERSGFCDLAVNASSPIMVLVEALDTAPSAGLAIRRCLREMAVGGAEKSSRFFVVATLGRELSFLSAAERAPFGYVAQMWLPDESQRKQFLLRLLQQISRVDVQWGSALREAAVVTLSSLTANYTFAEIELVLRRAFIRSTNSEGVRDPVALHHFEKILEEMPPQAAALFNHSSVVSAPGSSTTTPAVETRKGGNADVGKKKPKDVKDPMDGMFGWCNFWLPEALHLPPVVWAMIIFGILAHFMARSTYQPYSQRKRRGGSGSRSSLFGEMGADGTQFPSFGDQLNEWYPGGSHFPNFVPPPGMGRGSGSASNLFNGAGSEAGGAGQGDGSASVAGQQQPGGSAARAEASSQSSSAAQGTHS